MLAAGTAGSCQLPHPTAGPRRSLLRSSRIGAGRQRSFSVQQSLQASGSRVVQREQSRHRGDPGRGQLVAEAQQQQVTRCFRCCVWGEGTHPEGEAGRQAQAPSLRPGGPASPEAGGLLPALHKGSLQAEAGREQCQAPQQPADLTEPWAPWMGPRQ